MSLSDFPKNGMYCKLVKMINNRDFKDMEKLIENGFDVNKQVIQNPMLLILAVKARDYNFVKMFVDAGADLEFYEKFSRETALMKACYQDKLDIVKYLVEKGAKLNVLNNLYMTPLMIASKMNKLNIVKYLIQNGADINFKNITDMTALMYAFDYRCLETFIYFTNKNCQIDVQQLDLQFEHTGMTMLMMASIMNQPEFVKCLIKANAKLDIEDYSGNSALFLALTQYNIDVVKLLVEAGAYINNVALKYAMEKKYIDVVKLFVNKMEDINVNINLNKDSLLHCASGYYSSLRIVKYLVEKGICINRQNKYGETVLMRACKYGRTEITKFLLEKGVEIDKQNKYGETALIYACEKGRIETVKFLLDKGANSNIKDNRSRTVYDNTLYNEEIKNILKLMCEKYIYFKNTCIICYDNLENDGKLNVNKISVLIPCGHTFCKTCINDNISVMNKCPLCRCKIDFIYNCKI